MPKRQFGERFLDQMNDERGPQIAARLKSEGRSRANNSLAGVEWSNHVVPNKTRKTYDGERRHVTPTGLSHLRGEAVLNSPLHVRKHQIRVVSCEAPQRRTHIVPAPTGFCGSIGSTRSGSASSITRRGYCTPPTSAIDSPSRTVSAKPSPCRRNYNPDSLDFALVPKAVLIERPVPEPLIPKHYRRQRRSLAEPGSDGSDPVALKPTTRAMIDPPPHYVPAPARRGSITISSQNIAVGSFEPFSEQPHRPLNARVPSPCRGDRDYDVISLLPKSCVESTTPSRSSTPTRITQKNRCSSPNILAWN